MPADRHAQRTTQPRGPGGEGMSTQMRTRHVFLVTDPGVRSHGWADRVLPSIREAGPQHAIWDGVSENPKDV